MNIIEVINQLGYTTLLSKEDIEDFKMDRDEMIEELNKLGDTTALSKKEIEDIVIERKEMLKIELGETYVSDHLKSRVLNEDEKAWIDKLENKYGFTVYHVIKTDINGMDVTYFLYIPKLKGDLQGQINAMDNCGKYCQSAYGYNSDIPEYSEFGSVDTTGLISEKKPDNRDASNQNDVLELAIGNRYQFAVGRPDGPVLEYNSTGFHMYVFMNNPNNVERDSLKSTAGLQLKEEVFLGDVMMIAVKFGSLQWMDMPFSPHLYNNCRGLKEGDTMFIPDDKGMALTIHLFDTVTGELISQRLIGLGNRFSKKIQKDMLELNKKDFNIARYNNDIISVYNKYSTKQLLKYMSNSWHN